jgi:hypothetical protein
MINYVLIAQFLLFFGILKLFSKYTIHPIAAGIATALGAFAIEFTISSIYASQHGVSPIDLLMSGPLIQLLIQTVFGVLVFSLVKRYEDNLTAYLFIAVAGGISLFYLAPIIASNII